DSAGFPDSQYTEVGARILASAKELLSQAELVLQVQPPDESQLDALQPGTALVSFLKPLDEPELARTLAARKIDAFSVELMPRITRAQSMDVLSSQSTIAGYRAVLRASLALPRIFPMLVTAAGTLQPAKVFVIGAGVAGLQALGTAKRLGAVTSAYDTRPAVREQVESIGAKFVELDLDTGDAEDSGGYARAQSEDFYERQRAELAKHVAAADVVITTALVPGQPAPLLITEAAVHAMRPGSVIVDMAAEKGGNCALTRADEEVDVGGVTILGPTQLASEAPAHASQMYARNLLTYLKHLMEDAELQFDLEDEITSGTLVTREGEIRHPVVRERLGLEAPAEGDR
ncbi:MAG: Re/Si-specific NAD(P)(+) transhydrogenase subunit alpha, partial [Proteobacteria bacterium]|nr:Re/Si-specific NAD(P)(+) transhydrogenase subunit alpha [Pseudomonadota bacterium]